MAARWQSVNGKDCARLLLEMTARPIKIVRSLFHGQEKEEKLPGFCDHHGGSPRGFGGGHLPISGAADETRSSNRVDLETRRPSSACARKRRRSRHAGRIRRLRVHALFHPLAGGAKSRTRFRRSPRGRVPAEPDAAAF